MTEFDTADFWEKRLSKSFDLHGVGYHTLGVEFNKWIYKIRKRIFKKYVQKLQIDFKKTSVLDIGPGTGFYIERWKELGVKDISGFDITNIAVQSLSEKYPDYKFKQVDISADISSVSGKKYYLISAFDVLFHVVDDAKFEIAVKNIYSLLEPGGYFIFSDNFLHSETKRSHAHVSRSLQHISAVLAKAGFQIILRKPMFYFLNEPIDSNSRFLKNAWKRKFKIIPRNELYGNIIGAFLYPFELVVLSFLKEGPSTEIMICRK